MRNDSTQNVSQTYSPEYYSLIDRLKRHSEWKYSNRLWRLEFYNNVAYMWKDKKEALEERVLKLEDDMRTSGAL